MSEPFIFSWEVISSRFNEVELEFYQTYQPEHSGDYFNIKVHVKYQLCFMRSQPQLAPLIIPFDSFSYQNSMLLHSQELFKNGSSYMQMYFNQIIPDELISTMMPDVIKYAKTVAQNCRSGNHYESPQFRVFTLHLNIIVQKLYDEPDDDIINMVLSESMAEVEMVPTSKTAIDSIKKVKLKKDSVMESCRICLTEFDDGMEVSSMPCNHLYHQECLIQWLKTSHVCPLCRYPMPTSMTNY